MPFLCEQAQLPQKERLNEVSKRRQVPRDAYQMLAADLPLNIKPVISKSVWVRGQKEELKVLPLAVISIGI